MKNNKIHNLIIVPGLGGSNFGLEYISKLWSDMQLRVYIVDVGWRDKKINFRSGLSKVLKLIDSLPKTDRVSLLGTSAGGSMVLNAYYKRRDRILKVINVCGRLRRGVGVYPTLEKAASTSKSFKESVLSCENIEQKLNDKDGKKFLTIRPLFDEVVPISTMTIYGAKNIRVFSAIHVISILSAMTLYSSVIKKFLRS